MFAVTLIRFLKCDITFNVLNAECQKDIQSLTEDWLSFFRSLGIFSLVIKSK